MESASSVPPDDERTALAKLDAALQDAEAAVRAAPTPRVLWRARALLDRLVRAQELEQAGRAFGEALDAIHNEITESGLPVPTHEEIAAEVKAVRAARVRR